MKMAKEAKRAHFYFYSLYFFFNEGKNFMRLRFTVHSRVANYLIVQYMDLVYLRTP